MKIRPFAVSREARGDVKPRAMLDAEVDKKRLDLAKTGGRKAKVVHLASICLELLVLELEQVQEGGRMAILSPVLPLDGQCMRMRAWISAPI